MSAGVSADQVEIAASRPRLGRTLAVGLHGITGFVVDVEAQVAQGLPAFTVVGLGDSAVAQAPDRVRAACAQTGISVQQRKIVVNLSPADVRKVGSGFDLAIAVSALMALGAIASARSTEVVHLGELGLGGEVRPVRGILPAVLAARRAGIDDIVVPMANAAEAALAGDMGVHPVDSLADVIALHRVWATGARPAPRPVESAETRLVAPDPSPDLADVVGQEMARQALEVAAAGGHHVFLLGPPGAGKTMLAERLPGLLPALRGEESLVVSAVRSITAGAASMTALVERPPFEAPHHTASAAAIIGGGSAAIQPGSITRAHGGVLFLDESPEFKPAVLQALRQPLESGQVAIARAHDHVVFPARFQLVMAANPCPCGMLAAKGADCSCSPIRRRSYLGRLSGPLLDRVDLQVQVTVPAAGAIHAHGAESSAAVAARVAAARDRQRRRWEASPWEVNARVPGPVLRSAPWAPRPADVADLTRALSAGALSLRGFDRCLRIAWTLADLREAPRPERHDVTLALGLRQSIHGGSPR